MSGWQGWKLLDLLTFIETNKSQGKRITPTFFFFFPALWTFETLLLLKHSKFWRSWIRFAKEICNGFWYNQSNAHWWIYGIEWMYYFSRNIIEDLRKGHPIFALQNEIYKQSHCTPRIQNRTRNCTRALNGSKFFRCLILVLDFAKAKKTFFYDLTLNLVIIMLWNAPNFFLKNAFVEISERQP